MSNFKLTSIDKIVAAQPSNQWLIKNYMEINSIGMLFGAPASAKSFIAMDIAFCVAAGIDWNGNKTVQGNVVYLAGEGYNGMSKRFKALGLKYKKSPSNVYLSELPASLSDSSSGEAVEEAIENLSAEPALIVIDTLHRNFGCADENSASGFATFLKVLDTTIRKTKATILLVHHSGHTSSDRSRGSSAIKAALDFEYKIIKKEDSVTMDCTKAKEFEEPESLAFTLTSITFDDWLDDEGNSLGSAILNSTTYTKSKPKSTLSTQDKIVLNSLTESIDANGKSIPNSISKISSNLSSKKYINEIEWRQQAYLRLKANNSSNSTQAHQKAFSRAKDKLTKLGNVTCEDGKCWINDS